MLLEVETIKMANQKKVKFRKENDGYYYIVNPNTLDLLKFNYTGAFILYMKLYGVENKNIINMLADKTKMETEIISQWLSEFEEYLLIKEFL